MKSQSQQVVSSKNQTPGGAHPLPGADLKLKSERVQIFLQLPAQEQRRVQGLFAGPVTVGEVVTVSVDLTGTPEALRLKDLPTDGSAGGSLGGCGAIVEAGLASGTPGHNHQPSTLRKGE